MSDKEKKKKNNSSESAGNQKNKTPKTALVKRILKISAWVFGVIFALLILAVIFRDSLIKFGVTRIGSWIAGVEISLDYLDTSLSEGSVHLKGLRVANPSGFERPYMVELEEFYLDIDPGSLTSQEIVIEDIRCLGLTTTAEFDSQSRFNITTLTSDLQRRFPPKEGKEAAAEEGNPDDSDTAQKPTILIRNIEAKVKLTMVHDLSGANFSLPVPYSTTNLQIDPNEQSSSLLEKLNAAAMELESYCQACFNAGALVGQGVKMGIDAGLKSGNEVLNQSKDALNKGKDVLDKGGKEIFNQGKNLFESAGSLFKK